MGSEIDVSEHRQAEHDIDPGFVKRWSPRAMSGEEISREELFSLFEAARWAPSCYNDQPWRFLYARRGSPEWELFFSFLVEANQRWASRGAALIVVVSRRNFERNDKPNPTHSYDAGAAWMSLALEGSRRGLVVHGMAGFDYGRARRDLGVPEGWEVEAMAVAGRAGRLEDLPEPLREREVPSGRKAVAEIAFEGKFPGGTSW